MDAESAAADVHVLKDDVLAVEDVGVGRMAVIEGEVFEGKVVAVEDEHSIVAATGDDADACAHPTQGHAGLALEPQRTHEDAGDHADDVASSGAVDQRLDVVGTGKRGA